MMQPVPIPRKIGQKEQAADATFLPKHFTKKIFTLTLEEQKAIKLHQTVGQYIAALNQILENNVYVELLQRVGLNPELIQTTIRPEEGNEVVVYLPPESKK